MTKTTDQFGASVVGLARIWRSEIDRRLRPLGMSEARWLALHHLAKSSGELTQSKLAEKLGVRGPTLVSQLDQLEGDGWVTRRSSPVDRRSKVVCLTDEAMPLVEHIESVIKGIRGELFTGLDEDAVAQCLRLIDELRARVQALRDQNVAPARSRPKRAAPAAMMPEP